MSTAVATKTKPQDGKAIVQWKGEAIIISFQDVKGLICPLATDQEVAIFLKTCQSLQLNPFANECFLIKYDSREKAAFVIAIDSYLKAAESNIQYDGHEAGIILKDSGGKIELREGAFLLDEDRPRLAGGWAKIYRKDRAHPVYVAVNKNECIKVTREGKPTQFWAEPKQPWMLRKVALKRGLVEAFPSLYAGTLATAEIESDIEGELPRAFENNGKPDWRKFWVRVQDELQLTEEQAHTLLGVDSVKEIVAKSSLEEAWNLLIERIKEKNTVPNAPCEVQPPEETIDFNEPEPEKKNPIDMVWLRDALENKLGWHNVGNWLKNNYGETFGTSVRAMIESLSPEHKREFVAEVQKRLTEQVNDY
jgi:phage recombination protein Bet